MEATEIVKGRWYPELAPVLPGENPGTYTDRVTGADRTNRVPYDHRRNRQCSIGYHDECSDPDGETCECPCHYRKAPHRRHDDPKPFALVRDGETVARGVEFADGQAVMRWETGTDSTAIYDDMGDLSAIHVKGHEDTEILWIGDWPDDWDKQ